MTILETQGLAAKHAERVLAVAGTAKKNAALEAIAEALYQNQGYILAENEKDLAAAMASGMKQSLLDRLALNSDRMDGIVEGVRQVAALPDPIGQVTEMSTRPNGLIIGKRRVPLGVIGIIYEARPNVTVDAAALCLKSGNAVILRGGKEAFRSNKAFVAVMRDALESVGLPRDCVALVEDTSRESANELMGLTGYLDVLIPRGGAGLIRAVVANAKVPVIETGVGVCHVYVDASADLDMAAQIIYNAKTSRPSVCNAAECLLVHSDVAEDFLPLAKELLDQKQVELRGCPRTAAILAGQGAAGPEEGGAPGLPPDGCHPGRFCRSRPGERLGYGVRRLHPGGEGGGQLRPGGGLHQQPRLRPLRGHRHRGLLRRPGLPGPGGRGGGVRKRLHPLHRWL